METEEIEAVVDPIYLIGDTETCGIGKDKVACEVGLMKIDPVTFDVLWEIDSLIDPQHPISEGAMAIHGITQEMVADEPTMDEFVEHRLDGGIKGDITLICHNVPFDLSMLMPIGRITRTVCSLFEARMYLKGPADNKLQTLREYFGIKPNSAHRALADCDTTRQVLQKIVQASGRTLDELANAKERVVHTQPWGKFKGLLIVQLPVDYLTWLDGLPDLETNLRNSVVKALKMK